MFVRTILCFIFLLLGCITQSFQCVEVQKNDIENGVTTTNEIDTSTVTTDSLEKKEKPLNETKSNETHNFFKDKFNISEFKAEDDEKDVAMRTKRRLPKACLANKKMGPCKARIPRYYYDVGARKCLKFYWGGCAPNANNFKTQIDCMKVCIKKKSKPGGFVKSLGSKDICKLPSKKGNCKRHMVRWYYNSRKRKCMTFVYGGCQGNANNFLTKMACEKRCPPEKGTMTKKKQLKKKKGQFKKRPFKKGQFKKGQFKKRPLKKRPIKKRPIKKRPPQQKPHLQKPHPQKPLQQKPHPQKPPQQKPHLQRPHQQKPLQQKPHQQRPFKHGPHKQVINKEEHKEMVKNLDKIRITDNEEHLGESEDIEQIVEKIDNSESNGGDSSGSSSGSASSGGLPNSEPNSEASSSGSNSEASSSGSNSEASGSGSNSESSGSNSDVSSAGSNSASSGASSSNSESSGSGSNSEVSSVDSSVESV